MDGIDPRLLDRIGAAATTVPRVLAADEVRARWIGHRLGAALRLHLPARLGLTAASALADEVEAAVHRELPPLERVGVRTVGRPAAQGSADAEEPEGRTIHDVLDPAAQEDTDARRHRSR